MKCKSNTMEVKLKYTLMPNFKFAILLITFLICSCRPGQNENNIGESLISDEYKELNRPQFHFSPQEMWMNDPNGMVYHNGEYHLFYQFYPDSTVWGPMHWGHAVSPDMVHWEHLPIALYPDSLGYIFSGSAVMDNENTSGLGVGGKGPMIAIFTHHDPVGEKAKGNDFQYQSIAYSNDDGRTWTKYSGNPVVKNPGIRDFRDPKVIWDETNQQWVMVFAAYDKALFYSSKNLIDWKKTGDFGIEGDNRLWECPDLFPIKVEETGELKWVLIVSIQQQAPNGGTATGYFVGDFDGDAFIGDYTNQKWLDYGTDNYALVTWSDIPESDGRRLGLGWMSNWQYAQVVPTDPWRSAMTLPRSLTLHYENGGYELRNNPVKEMEALEKEKRTIPAQKISDGLTLVDDNKESLYRLDLTFKKPTSGMIALKASNSKGEYVYFGYNVKDNTYFIDRTHSGKVNFSDDFADYHTGVSNYLNDEVSMTIFLDWSSIEIFGDKGRTVMTDIYFPSEPYGKIEIETEFNDVDLISAHIKPLKGIWN
jgi:fructan beta-fructosidase